MQITTECAWTNISKRLLKNCTAQTNLFFSIPCGWDYNYSSILMWNMGYIQSSCSMRPIPQFFHGAPELTVMNLLSCQPLTLAFSVLRGGRVHFPPPSLVTEGREGNELSAAFPTSLRAWLKPLPPAVYSVLPGVDCPHEETCYIITFQRLTMDCLATP